MCVCDVWLFELCVWCVYELNLCVLISCVCVVFLGVCVVVCEDDYRLC